MVIRRRGGARWILAVMAAAVALFFLFPQTRNRPISLLEVPFVWTASQMTRLSYGATTSVATFWEDHMALTGVRRENRVLVAERDQLLLELANLDAQVEQNERMAELLEFRAATPHQIMPARIIGADATHWFQSFLIDQGSFAGIAPGDGVISPQGVVGRIVKVTHNTAQVLAAHNRLSVIPARVERSRHAGILVGGPRASQGRLTGDEISMVADPSLLVEMKYMYRAADVVPGDTVVTSGLEGNFPAGLPVGKVVRVVRKQTETFLKVYVAPQVLFDTLEEVMVVRGDKRKDDGVAP